MCAGFVFAQKTIYDANAVLREGKGYNAIEVSDGIDLFISYGDEAIAVSASEVKYRDKIKTVVDNGVLKIFYDEKGFSWNTKRNLKAYVSFKNLEGLSASGGSDILVEGNIKGNLMHPYQTVLDHSIRSDILLKQVQACLMIISP